MDAQGVPPDGDHARRVAAGARLPHGRTSASGTSATRRRCVPTRRASTSTSASIARRVDVSSMPTTRASSTRCRTSTRSTVFLWANLPFAVRKDGGAALRARRLHDRLPRRTKRRGAIAANRHRPFFLYFAPNAPHTPLQALRSDYDALPQIADHRLRVYAAMVRALDRAVGRVLEALKANGLEHNTLVFFTSDNGGANYIGLPDINKPYRGWKMTFFEGGIHSPFFAKWPARRRRPERRFAAPVGHDRHLRRRPPRRRMRRAAIATADRWRRTCSRSLRGDGDRAAAPITVLALGRLQVGARRRLEAAGLRATAARPGSSTSTRTRPSASTSSAKNPDKVRELKAILAAHEAEMVMPAWPSLIEGPIDVDHPLGVPERPDDEYVYWEN